jgi:hypothetical protein
MSIALPVELKGRMKAVEKCNVINWSKACQQQIESELAFLEGQSADQTATIERLRASKLESERQDAIDGKAAGREWARNKAHYSFLKRLQRSVDRHFYDRPWDRLRMVLDPQGESSDDALCEHLLGDGYDDLDDIPNSPTFLNAFIVGAIEAWQKLAPKIEGAHRAAQPTASAANSALTVMRAQMPEAALSEPIVLVAPVEAPEASGAHPADADCRPGRRDGVTLVLAEVAEAPVPPPRPRPVLSIVRDTVADLYTNARDWLARECPIDYGS